MSIRETWNRIVRKSESSTSSSERSNDDDARFHPVAFVAPIPNGSKHSSSSRIGKITSWRSTASSNFNSHSTFSVNKPTGRTPRTSLIRDPSKRKLTRENLRHQEMLGTFTMKFGRSRRHSRGTSSSLSDISPGCSRAGSLDLGRGGSMASTEAPPLSPSAHADTRLGSFWRGPWEQEIIAEESS